VRGAQDSGATPARGRKQPRPEPLLTEAGLVRSALWHLGRRALTEVELRRALDKKVKRAAATHGPTPQAGAWIDAVLARCADALFVDDARVARARVEGLRAAGASRRKIAQKLQLRGVAAALVQDTVAAVDADRASGRSDDEEAVDPELLAAIRCVEKKRLLGKDTQKALAALGRQGFSCTVAKAALSNAAAAVADSS
jgi:SOS response regulatory protein OraA/RecX